MSAFEGTPDQIVEFDQGRLALGETPEVDVDEPVPYDELDPNIVAVVRELNAFPGIYTIGSCGGHADPKPFQLGARHWNVIFRIDHTDDAYLSLEFVGWFFQASGVPLSVGAPSPYMNGPGTVLYFAVNCVDLDPEELAKQLATARDVLYVTAEELAEEEGTT